MVNQINLSHSTINWGQNNTKHFLQNFQISKMLIGQKAKHIKWNLFREQGHLNLLEYMAVLLKDCFLEDIQQLTFLYLIIKDSHDFELLYNI